MENYDHPILSVLDPLGSALEAAASATARAVKHIQRARRPRHRGQALHPGADTPLWNELAAACAAQFGRRGEKAKLARLLGVPRQRVHQFLVAKTSCPDAERTLQLVVWLSARRKGQPPA